MAKQKTKYFLKILNSARTIYSLSLQGNHLEQNNTLTLVCFLFPERSIEEKAYWRMSGFVTKQAMFQNLFPLIKKKLLSTLLMESFLSTTDLI